MDLEFSDLHFSMGQKERSLTDPTSNYTFISGSSIDDILANLANKRPYPPHLFSPLIHEVTHHWCFHSAVGTSLALLHMRARRRLLLFVSEPDHPNASDFTWDFMEDYIRYETGMTFLQPLSEGLALFAEFNTFPGESNIISTPLALSTTLFATHDDWSRAEELGYPQGTDYLSFMTLYRQRLSAEFQNKKINLLCHPLTCEDGGYLLGYLTIQNIWHMLVSERGYIEFLDKDLFLCFMRSFFYDDWGLVSKILDPATKELDSAQAIQLHIQNRIRYLFTELSQEEVQGFESSIGNLPKPSSWPNAMNKDEKSLDRTVNIGTEDLLVKSGKSLFEALFDQLLDKEDDSSLESIMRVSDIWALTQRELICLASFQEHVRVNRYGRVQIGVSKILDGGEIIPKLSVQSLEDVAPLEGEGSIEFFLAPISGYRFMSVWLNGNLVALDFQTENVDPRIETQVRQYRTSFAQSAETRNFYQEVLRQTIEKNATLSIVLEHFRKEAKSVTQEYYQRLALIYIPDTLFAECVTSMKDSGFYEILGKDGGLIRSISKLSLLNSLTSSRDTLESHQEMLNIKIDDILKKSEHFTSRWGFPLFYSDTDTGTLISWI